MFVFFIFNMSSKLDLLAIQSLECLHFFFTLVPREIIQQLNRMHCDTVWLVWSKVIFNGRNLFFNIHLQIEEQVCSWNFYNFAMFFVSKWSAYTYVMMIFVIKLMGKAVLVGRNREWRTVIRCEFFSSFAAPQHEVLTEW